MTTASPSEKVSSRQTLSIGPGQRWFNVGYKSPYWLLNSTWTLQIWMRKEGKPKEVVVVATVRRSVEEEKDEANGSRNVAPISRDWWGHGDSNWAGSPLWVAD
jgi:hypothetical protein